VTDAQQALARVLDPAYLATLEQRSLAELRAMHTECVELENFFSYVRRIAQGRLDILTAEIERRSTGGSVGELVAALPKILGGDDEESRPPAAQTRLVPHLAPDTEYELPQELATVLADDTLARLPSLTDDEVRAALDELDALEKRFSSERRSLHEVIDRIERDLAARLVVEA